jgi:hypothetical protein
MVKENLDFDGDVLLLDIKFGEMTWKSKNSELNQRTKFFLYTVHNELSACS